MLDSSGRVPQGVLQGNSIDLGNYDECVNIHEELETGDINGRYCYSGLAIPLRLTNTDVLSPVNYTEAVRRFLTLFH